MTSLLPPVRQAALVYRRGEENLALRIHFKGPLSRRQQGIMMGGVAEFIVASNQVYEPEFPQDRDDIVLLQPAPKQGLFGQTDFKAVVRHFGFEPSDDLPIFGTGQTGSPEDNGESFVVAGSHWVQ